MTRVCAFGQRPMKSPDHPSAITDALQPTNRTLRSPNSKVTFGKVQINASVEIVVERSPIETRVFRSPEEIDSAIAKIRRRIDELKKLDIASAYLNKTGADDVAISNVKDTLREVFGSNSPEFHEHGNISFWHLIVMAHDKATTARELQKGQTWVIGILNGLVARLEEKRSDLRSGSNGAIAPSTYFDRLNLHPRILGVARARFLDGYPWDAVFAASKALINFVKECSEQEGMMHLFEGAVLAIRNPGGHDFPEGPEQRAIEYISLLSLLAYRLQDAKRRK